MTKIIREPASAAKETYDLIVVGGGIYGAMLSLEASRRGLRSLLMEQDDFGGATSFNSLRIIHGGLRYLQSLDLHRFRESVGERRWFLQTFPGLVEVLPCLMPLYGDGLRRPFVLRTVLRTNDFLSRKRNQGVRPDRHVPPGRVIDAHQTRQIFRSVDTQDLVGGAIWYDAFMPDSQRLLIEILRWSCECGAIVLNYVKALQLLKNKGSVAGVLAIDLMSGQANEYRAKIVVNVAGPWCRELAARFDRDDPCLFKSSIAWNVLLNREPLSDHAVAVAPKKVGGRTYFLVPWKQKIVAGTGHAAWFGGQEKPMPSTKDLQEFLNDLNLAVPSLEVHQNDILYVFAGLLPITKVGSAQLTTREVILDHSSHGGPRGFYSISGVKFTTARLVAEKTLNHIFPEKITSVEDSSQDFRPPQDAQNGRGLFPFDWRPPAEDSKWKDTLQRLIVEEAVQHPDDLIFRRTNLWNYPPRARKMAPLVCELFDWDNTRRVKEIERLTHSLGNERFIKTSEYRKES